MPNCRVCKAELTKENTHISYEKSHDNICKTCKNKQSLIRSKNYAKTPKGKQNQKDWINKYHRNLRIKIIQLLGGKCANPYNLNHGDFIADRRCLQIDHINGNGRKERITFPSTSAYQNYILKQIKAGSKDYQLLCANCNWIKRVMNKEFKRP